MTKSYLNGPWKEIFTGKWEDYEIEMLENPDKIILTQIFDKDGVVSVTNKIYVTEGNISKIVNQTNGYFFVFEKYDPVFKASYLMISSGPEYSKKEDIDIIIKKEFSEMNKLSEEMNEKAKVYDFTLTEIKYSDEKFWKKLFSEPILLPGLLAKKTEQLPEARITGKALLGKKITGEFAEENMQSFIRTELIGERTNLENLAKVVIENCVLNGITAVAFDDENEFEKMGVPNNQFNHKIYPGLQPIGMPVNTKKPGEVKIDLNLLSTDMFREIIGIPERKEEYMGKTAIELIDKVLEKSRGELKNLDELEEKLLTVTEESKKFHIYKAIRWVRVLKKVYPDYFGKMNISEIVSQYMKTMGSITRIDLLNEKSEIKKAFIYSIMKILYEQYKGHMSSSSIKVIGININAEKYVPREVQTPLQRGILEIISKSPEYGVGYCFGAEHEMDIYPEIDKTTTMKIEFVSSTEAAVKEINSRPYRATIRPRLSA